MSSASPSSPQVSRSYSYPLEAPWHSDNPMNSRKESVESNNSTDSGFTNDDGEQDTSTNTNVPANTNTSDKLVPPRLKHGKSPADEVKVKNRMWRASGSLVQQRLAAWKPEQPLDLSHLNLDSIPKQLFKGDHYITLKALNLSSNKISSLPSQISLLKLLVSLDCTFNRISDLPVELGELHSLEHLHLSGNPLNKELMQKHLLGTGAVLHHLRERQMAESGRVRRSGKILPKSLKASSEPTHSPPISLPPSSSNPSITLNSSLSPLAVATDSLRNPLSSSDPNLPNQSSPQLLSPQQQQQQTLQRQKSNSVPPPGLSPSLSSSLASSTTSSSSLAVSNGSNPPSSPIVEPPRGDMGPIVVQLKLGIIYAETVNKTPTIISPVINVTPPSASVSPSSLSPNDIPSSTPTPKHRKTPSTNVDELANQLHKGTGKEKFTVHGDGRFTFNSYCSQSFLEVRNLSGVPQDRFLAALDSISALGFAGKSGAVLLKSADNLLVLKTISKDEAKFLRKIMPQYLAYLKANPKTYLTKFWGLYKVIRGPIEKASFVVMKNAFFTSKKIHERYDLKGSTVGRTTDEENVRRSRIVLKDLNFNRQLRLGENRCQVFLQQIEKDTEFLQKFEIIDYSLIVGVHYLSDAPTRDPNVEYPIEGEIQAIDKEGQLLDEMYYLAIIDMLQPYNIRKQMEYNIKSLRYGQGISVIPPVNYANRFLSFIQSVVE